MVTLKHSSGQSSACQLFRRIASQSYFMHLCQHGSNIRDWFNDWGFSAGDIAALAGAGRAVGNWLMAQARDRSLLEFQQVDPNDVILRKGLIDRFALHDRWDTKLTLLKNGRRRVIQPPGGRAVENIGSFT